MIAPLLAVAAMFGLVLAWLLSIWLNLYVFVFGLLLAWSLFPWVLFRSSTYKPQPDTRLTGPGWEQTEERFVDPTSSEVLVVWHHFRTGEHTYVRAT